LSELLLSQVTIKVEVNGQPRHVWFTFESDHADLFELNEDLVTDGTVFGQRIETERVGQGVRREVHRYDTILSKDVIVSIAPLQFRLDPPGAAIVERAHHG